MSLKMIANFFHLFITELLLSTVDIAILLIKFIENLYICKI